MNERSSVIPSIAGSLARITRRARSQALSDHDTKQISQQLWKLAQCRLFNAKATSKLSLLEDASEGDSLSRPKTKKEKLEMSKKTLGLYLLDNDDNDEGFQDMESLLEDDFGYDMSQRSLDGELGIEDLQDTFELEDERFLDELDVDDMDMLSTWDDLALPPLPKPDPDVENHILIFSDL